MAKYPSLFKKKESKQGSVTETCFKRCKKCRGLMKVPKDNKDIIYCRGCWTEDFAENAEIKSLSKNKELPDDLK